MLSRLCAHTYEEAQLFMLDDYSIPKDKYKIIAKVHNSTAGHNGVEKTLEKLTSRGELNWPHMREHVKRFIKECPICQKLDNRSVNIHIEPFTTASAEPMDTLNIDSIGPVPTDDLGNVYILVIICCFTRFVELYPVPDTSAKHAARCILQHIGRYGTPIKIRTDRGSQFVNEIVKELLVLIGVEHQLTLQYSKEENAIVERANKEVMRHLRAILLDKKVIGDWSISLPLVQRIMNASVHSALKLSPAQLLFGNAITLDRGIFLDQKKSSDEKIPLSVWAENMLKKQAQLIEIAQSSQEATDNYHIVKASEKLIEFPINSYVLVKYRESPPTKFHSNWGGPMRVVGNKKSTYTLQDLVTLKTHDFHVTQTQLKAFNYDQMEVNPVDIARAEAQQRVVEAILEHSGGPKRKSYQFLVKWANLDDSYTSWQPWNNVRDNEVLNKYLYQNKLKSLLTKEQKAEVRDSLANNN
jgi:hypothetical protein